MHIVFLGDLLGRSGRNAAMAAIPRIISTLEPDLLVVNAENAAGGFGVTSDIAEALFEAGADVITLGNHAFDNREVLPYLGRESRIIRPLNLPVGSPGRGSALVTARNGASVLVINALGRIFMNPVDDPFSALDQAVSACPLGSGCDAIIVDFHAEATSEKAAMGHWLDGRVSLVVGTHTHIPTADAQILPKGTAYQTDAGMCGDYDSVIGMDKEEPLYRFVTGMSQGRFIPKIGDATICGTYVATGADGLAKYISPIRLGGRLLEAMPKRWEAGATA